MDQVKVPTAGEMIRGNLDDVEQWLMTQVQPEIRTEHHFAPGIYLRELHVPAGTVGMGHAHKTEHLNILVKGHIVLLNQDGTTTDIVAPAVWRSPPGRKVARFLEDTVWQNVLPTDETCVAAIESIFIEKSEAWLLHESALSGEEVTCLSGQ